MSFSQEDLDQLKAVFDAVDVNGNGSISIDELEKALETAEVSFDRNEVKAKVREADKDKSGEIDFKEFVAYIQKNLGEADE